MSTKYYVNIIAMNTDDFPLTVLINGDSVYLRWDVFSYMHASCVWYCVCGSLHCQQVAQLSQRDRATP